MVVQQGDVIWVKLPRPRGSEPASRRPALVLQSDAFNRSRLNTVVVAAITSNLKLEGMPGNLRLSRGEAGIPKTSIVNVTQIHAIDRQYIEAKMGRLTQARLAEVQNGLKLLFEIA